MASKDQTRLTARTWYTAQFGRRYLSSCRAMRLYLTSLAKATNLLRHCIHYWPFVDRKFWLQRFRIVQSNCKGNYAVHRGKIGGLNKIVSEGINATTPDNTTSNLHVPSTTDSHCVGSHDSSNDTSGFPSSFSTRLLMSRRSWANVSRKVGAGLGVDRCRPQLVERLIRSPKADSKGTFGESVSVGRSDVGTIL